MPEDTYPAFTPAKGGTHERMRSKEELGMRQDGFLPLLHTADLSLTLPVGGRGGRKKSLIVSSPKSAKMISTSPGEAQEIPFQ